MLLQCRNFRLARNMAPTIIPKVMFWLDGLVPSYKHFGIDVASIAYTGWFINKSSAAGISAVTLTTLTLESIAHFIIEGSIVQHALIVLGLNCIARGADWNFRNRWPVTFPVLATVALELVRLSLHHTAVTLMQDTKRMHWWLSSSSRVLSNLVLVSSVVLCALFPVVKLGDPKGPHSIGIIEHLEMPVDWETAAAKVKATQPAIQETKMNKVIGEHSYLKTQQSVTARLFYPADLKKTSTTASCQYIPSSFSSNLCDNVMKSAAQYPLNQCGFLLYNWKLIRIPATPNAPLLKSENKQGLPLVVYSHGLVGSPHVYTKQALDLASSGYMVLMIHHRDGSSPFVPLEKQEKERYDEYKEWLEGFVREKFKLSKDFAEVVRFRRRQTVFRTTEVLAATESLLGAHQVHSDDASSPTAKALSRLFGAANPIDTKRIIFMGHSFGGATAMTAVATALFHASTTKNMNGGSRWSPSAVIAHEPANDWSPDFTRYTLFDNTRLKLGYESGGTTIDGDKINGDGKDSLYTGGTGGYDCGDEAPLEKLLGYMSSSGERKNTVSTVQTIHDIPAVVMYSNEWASKGWGGSPMMKLLEESKNEHRGSSSPFQVHVIPHASHQEFSDTCSLIPLWIGRLTKQIAPKSESGGKSPIDRLDIMWNYTYNHFLQPLEKAGQFCKLTK
jgi:dienelactone hydrolase